MPLDGIVKSNWLTAVGSAAILALAACGGSDSSQTGSSGASKVSSVACSSTTLSCGFYFCCPQGHPYECGGNCYDTGASATAQCSAYYTNCN